VRRVQMAEQVAEANHSENGASDCNTRLTSIYSTTSSPAGCTKKVHFEKHIKYKLSDPFRQGLALMPDGLMATFRSPSAPSLQPIQQYLSSLTDLDTLTDVIDMGAAIHHPVERWPLRDVKAHFENASSDPNRRCILCRETVNASSGYL
jgi:hypothetical protein